MNNKIVEHPYKKLKNQNSLSGLIGLMLFYKEINQYCLSFGKTMNCANITLMSTGANKCGIGFTIENNVIRLGFCTQSAVGKLFFNILNILRYYKDTIVEKDYSGNIIAYKYLLFYNNNFHSLFGPNDLHEPESFIEWTTNSLDADSSPEINNTNGIYSAKTIYSHILKEFYKGFGDIGNFKLVKLLLSGKVIESEYGYRAEHADIIEVLS